MSFDLAAVNVWAVLVSAIATFMIGGVWYGLLFAQKWVAVHGFSDDEVAAMQKMQVRNFGVFIAGDLVMAVVVSLFVVNLGINSAAHGALLGLCLWVGVRATIGAAKNAAYNKPLAAFAIDTSHELACLLVMGAIVGGWR